MKNFSQSFYLSNKLEDLAEKYPKEKFLLKNLRQKRHDLPKKIWIKGSADWFDEPPDWLQKWNIILHSSTKMNTIRASKMSNEKEEYKNLKHWRK